MGMKKIMTNLIGMVQYLQSIIFPSLNHAKTFESIPNGRTVYK